MAKFWNSSFVDFVKSSPILYKKIKRPSKNTPSIGLALGGGAVWGICHIGVLKALEDNHIPVHAISGTSIGAFIGGLYAAGVSVDKLIELSTTTQWRDLSRLSLPPGGLLSNQPMEGFLNNLMGNIAFSELKLPFAAVATDLIHGEEIILNDGKVSTAIRASTAIPGIFHPVIVNNRTLVDGGVVNNIPVSTLKKMNTDKTIAVNLCPSLNHWKPKNSLEIILKSYLIMQNKVVQNETKDADVLINIDMNGFSPIDLSKSKALLNKGLIAGLSHMPSIQALNKNLSS